jgi:HSP20 family protein
MATRRQTRTTTTTSGRTSQNQGLGQATGAAVGGMVGAAGDAVASAAGSATGAGNQSGNRGGGRASGAGTSAGSGRTTSGGSASASGRSGAGRSGSAGDQELSVTVNQEGTSGSPQRSGAVSRARGPGLTNLFAPALLPGAFMANPFEFMRRMSEQMDQVFGGSMFGQGGPMAQTQGAGGVDRQRGTGVPPMSTSSGLMTGWAPQIEIVQRGDRIVVRADLPGLEREDVEVEIDEGMLTISGERRQESRDEREGFIRSERSYGSFYRAIPLPDSVDTEQISATFRNGVLEVSIPVPEDQQQRRRRIQVTDGRTGSA